MSEEEPETSLKPKNKTRKIKALKVPKDPEEIEEFCIHLLQKKDAEKKKDAENIPSEKGSSPIPIRKETPTKISPKEVKKSSPIVQNVIEQIESSEKVISKKSPKKKRVAKTEKIPKPEKVAKEKVVKEKVVKNKTVKKQKEPLQQGSPKQPENIENNMNEKSVVPVVPVVPVVAKVKRRTAKRMSPKIMSPKRMSPKRMSPPKKDIEPKVLSINNMPKDAEKSGESNIQEFKDQGITVLEKLSQKELEHMLVVANSNYYNEKGGLMTDNEYDIVKEYIESKYPTNEIVNQIGAPILDNVKNKVKLPYEMWSMDKIKPDTNALSKWKNTYKGPYVLSCKLDGVSGLYSTEGPTPKLYTRGDGKVGQDISFLIPHLKLPKKNGIVVRGEFIIPKKVFQEKYAEQFANPRNLVSGIVNSKKSDAKVKDLHFVAYEVIMPKMKPSEQLEALETDEFEVVQHETQPTITNESLSDTLVDWRTNYKYEIDGVIVTDDAVYSRSTGNPEHAFAFKMMLSDQKAEVKVVDVVWSPSKDGFLKPRVRIEPVRLGGVTIEYATGYNAKFIEENHIGIGAIIEIIRSGDVIPKIISVTVPAEKAKMPTEEYKWNETHVDILLENASDNSTVQEKKLTAFFSSLEIDGLKAGNVKKLKDAGYDTIPKILQMTKADFEKVGYKSLAQKYVDTIREKIEKATIIQLMAASGTMGRSLGERKIEPILEAHPDILVSTDSVQAKITKVKSVKGIELKTATLFVENIPQFIEFLESIGQTKKLSGPSASSEPAIDVDTSNPLYGKRIAMTNVRDSFIIEALEKRGAIWDDKIGSKTSILIVKSYEGNSSKMAYAEKNKIPMFTPADFIKKYL